MPFLPFSESTNKTGMYEVFQRLTKTNTTSYSAYKFATDANMALSDYSQIAREVGGASQFDDYTQVKYPELEVDLISGQFDYPFTTDAEDTPNQIISVDRVEMATDATGAKFVTLEYYDEMRSEDSIVQARTKTGTPTRYSKKANGIFLDTTPNYNCRLATEGVAGLRIFISRMSPYFTGTDTTKEAGIPDDHKQYLIFKPAFRYCVVNLPSLASGYLLEVQKLEKSIRDYYTSRNRDERRIATSKKINFR